MDIKMEITFRDGSKLNITETQLRELKSHKINTRKNLQIDSLKNRILKNLESCGGEITNGRLINILRCSNNIDFYDSAIESLVYDGVIKTTESLHKYNKNKVLTLTLV